MSAIKTSEPRLTMRVASATVICAGAMLALFWPSWSTLWITWFEESSSYSHGPLVILTCLWLVYELRWRLQTNQPTSTLIQVSALVVGLVASVVCTIGFLTGINVFQWLTLPIISATLAIVACGKRPSAHLLVPFIGLYFALPVWELLVPMLQQLAVLVVRLAIHILGAPAYINGIEITIPGGQFVVEGGCSGVRYLLVASAIAGLWSYLQLNRWRDRSLIMLTAILLALGANWFRILAIIAIGFLTDMQSGIIYDHENFGWLIFAAALVPLLGLCIWLERKQGPAQMQPIAVASSWSIGRFFLACAVIGLAPAIGMFMLYRTEVLPPPQPVTVIPKAGTVFDQAHLQGQFVMLQSNERWSAFSGWKPTFPGIQSWRQYRYEVDQLEILMGHIDKQTQRQEIFSAMNSFKALSRSSQWRERMLGDNMIQITNVYGQTWIARIYYRVGGELTLAGLSGKLTQLQGIAKGRGDAQLIFAGRSCSADCSIATEQLEQITPEILQSWLQEQPVQPHE